MNIVRIPISLRGNDTIDIAGWNVGENKKQKECFEIIEGTDSGVIDDIGIDNAVRISADPHNEDEERFPCYFRFWKKRDEIDGKILRWFSMKFSSILI